MPRTLVRYCASTLMYPCSNCSPVLSASRPAVTGLRPVATSRVLDADLQVLAIGELRFNVDPIAGRCGTRQPGAGMGGDALPTERSLQFRRHRLVLDRHQPWQQLEDRHITAEAAENARELHADRAASENRNRGRHRTQTNGLIAGDDAHPVDGDTGDAPRRRAGGDDDLFARAQRLLLAIDDVHSLPLALSRQPCCSLDPVDLVLLEEKLDAPRQA